MTRVLLTGIGGFIGSHCVRYFLDNTDWEIIGIDSFPHKGVWTRLDDVDYDPARVKIFRHDLSVPIDDALLNKITDRKIEDGVAVSKPIDIIISMAADSAVERSVKDPVSCWRNNCDVGVNMLELSRKLNPKTFFLTSTDEVYGDCPQGYSHPEWDVINPSNPYAASKAAMEAVSISYWRTFHVPLVICNIMNCIATMQDKEKFLPKLIWKIATNQEMEIYADPQPDGTFFIGSRYYLHAQNHADAYVFLSNRSPTMYKDGARQPDRYNVVGEVELNNLEMAKLVAELMGKELKYRLVSSESARPGYDRRYALDGSKLRSMGWKPPLEFKEGLKQIVDWTLSHPWWL